MVDSPLKHKYHTHPGTRRDVLHFICPCKHACVAFLTFFPWYHHKVRVKRYFDPDTELLRALHFRNSKNIRNPLIFLQKMASYSCFWRGPKSKILLQARLRRIFDLFPLVSSYIYKELK